MKLSSRVRYGVRALVELASMESETPVLLETVASRQGISRKYLDAIFARLKAGGLLRSSRGVGGGFVLAKAADQVTLAEIYQALEGPIQLADCLSEHHGPGCGRTDLCPTIEVWSKLSGLMREYLESVTLAHLVEKYRNRVADGTGMFYI